MKLVFLILLGLISFNIIQAQRLAIGPKFGINYGGYIGKADTTATGKPIMNIIGGLELKLKITKRWEIAPSVYYTKKSVEFGKKLWEQDTTVLQTIQGQSVLIPSVYNANINGNIDVSYIESALNFRYYFTKLSYINFGGFYGIKQKGSLISTIQLRIGRDLGFNNFIYDTVKVDDSQKLHKVDYGFTLGGGVTLLKRLDVNITATKGMSDVLPLSYTQGTRLRSLYVNATLAYYFFRI